MSFFNYSRHGEYMFETSSDSSDGGRAKWDDETDDQMTDLLDTQTTLPPTVAEPPPTTFQGYTPRNSFGGTPNVGGQYNLRWQTITGVSTVTSHAPAGIGWVPASAWASSTWDGVPYNVAGKTTAQICSWVFPTSNTMRGLRQLYESVPPFANPAQPTWQEIDAWNIKVINHFRGLFGIGPITPTYRLYAEAQWSTERRWSTRWDGYPNNIGLNPTGALTWGPCPNANVHCGATFLPAEYEQVWYMLPNGQPTSAVRQSMAEALGGTNTNIPWSIKLARVIASFLCNEGLTGHTGPFLQRQKIGMIFHDLGDGTTQVRFKFGGTFTAFP